MFYSLRMPMAKGGRLEEKEPFAVLIAHACARPTSRVVDR